MRSFVLLSLLLSSSLVAAADDPLSFQTIDIDPHIGKVCYAVTLADVNGDHKDDIVAVSETAVYWYRNPDWSKHVIIENQTPADNVCIAPHDIDGDGEIDFALGAGWMGKNTGTIHWLRRGDSLEEPWHVYSIGAEPWLHRMRWGDVLGTGRPQLTISPLNATQGNGVRLTALEIPADPAHDRWPSTVLNADLNRMHNHWHVRFDDVVDTLTASREGIHVIRRQGAEFLATKLADGATHDDPNLRGAGEIKAGHLDEDRRYLCSVEPMHGTMLAVYLLDRSTEPLWARHVIDEGFQRGHALWTADLNGDGIDEIIFGHSDTPQVPGVNVYIARDRQGETWDKLVVDAGGMATEDLIVGDVTGDGRPDIVAGGRATHNVRLYSSQAP